MVDRYLLESGSPDGYQLEDGSGVLALDNTTIEIVSRVNTAVTYQGSGLYQITKTAGVAATWDADAVSNTGLTGDFVLRFRDATFTGNYACGLNSDPATDSNWTSIDYGLASYGGTIQQINGGSAGSTATMDTYGWVWRVGTTIGVGTGATLAAVQAAPLWTTTVVVATLYFDSSFTTVGTTTEVYLYIPVNSYTLTAAAGSFALTGSAATLKRTLLFSATAGSYALTGSAATLRVTMPATAGAFTLTGSPATLRIVRTLTASAGSFALSGASATLRHGYTLAAGSGSYSLTGQAAALTAQHRMTAGSGSFALNGQTASLLRSLRVVADSGGFSLNGSTAALTKAGVPVGYTMSAMAGAFTLAGRDAELSQFVAPYVQPLGWHIQAKTGSWSAATYTSGTNWNEQTQTGEWSASPIGTGSAWTQRTKGNSTW